MPIFTHPPRREVLKQLGNVKYVRDGEIIEVWSGNSIISAGNNSVFYAQYLPYTTGKVLEVGTGYGDFSRLAILKPDVTKVYSVEIDKGTADIYADDVKNSKLVVINDDIFLYAGKTELKFDTILFDIDPTENQEIWNKSLLFFKWCKTHLTPTGKILIWAFKDWEELNGLLEKDFQVEVILGGVGVRKNKPNFLIIRLIN